MLTDSRHQFSLAHAPVPSAPQRQSTNPTAPFGLKYAVPATEVVDVDSAEITYDAARQVSVIADEEGATILAVGRHTSTQTKTSTASKDRSGNDSDTDATGDWSLWPSW